MGSTAIPLATRGRRLIRQVLPASLRQRLLRAAGRTPLDPQARRRLPLRPGSPGGLRRVQVGCGPTNLLADWWNVDIRAFRGIDEVVDATKPWPWRDLDAIYGEHFLEHLAPSEALAFATEAARALRPGGVLRLSTPSLEHVWVTHFHPVEARDPAEVVAETYRSNRAFHGWGHRFLFSRPMLDHLLTSAGFTEVTFHDYGASERDSLRGLERHPGWEHVEGWPTVWIVEAVSPGPGAVARREELADEIEREFERYVRSGH
jgi:predicted SAM-dependent methyltransferase